MKTIAKKTKLLTFLISLSLTGFAFSSSADDQKGFGDQSSKNLKIYFGTLSNGAEKKGKSCSDGISEVQLNVDRVDYLTKKGWYSLPYSQNMNFKPGESEAGKPNELLEADGFSKIRLVLNKNKHGKIRDHRGHECLVKDGFFEVGLKKGLSLQNVVNGKLKVFLDLRSSSFHSDKDRICVFKPKFQVYSSSHSKDCLKKSEHIASAKRDDDDDDRDDDDGRGRHSHGVLGFIAQAAHNLHERHERHERNEHHKSCGHHENRWDSDDRDRQLGEQCHHHGSIPVVDPAPAPAPTPAPTPVPEPTPAP
ncbi:MAG: hypothetical protein ACXWRZ_11745, partial [Bdellovibrio sp.]